LEDDMTEKIQWEAIKWPENMAPSRSPIHFTNELVVAAAPETIWSLLVDPGAWPSFYPDVEHVQLLDRHESLRLGTRFETNLAGQDVVASVEEFEPMTRIAFGSHTRNFSRRSAKSRSNAVAPAPKKLAVQLTPGPTTAFHDIRTND
jgi:uncharacterized protein YndB with AHSA1/START domain